jgi:hypothetical protein
MEHAVKGFIIGFALTMITLCSPAAGQELIPDEEGVLPEEVQRSKPVECYTADSVVKLADANGFQAFWQGPNQKDNQPDNTIVVFVRPDTNAWIAIEMNMEAACILGYGKTFWLFNQFYQHLEPLDLLQDEVQ